MQCPRCKIELSPEGAIDFGDQHLTVYQCEQCIRPWEFGGQTFEVALTFAVDSDGRLFDPETFELLNLN